MNGRQLETKLRCLKVERSKEKRARISEAKIEKERRGNEELTSEERCNPQRLERRLSEQKNMASQEGKDASKESLEVPGCEARDELCWEEVEEGESSSAEEGFVLRWRLGRVDDLCWRGTRGGFLVWREGGGHI